MGEPYYTHSSEPDPPLDNVRAGGPMEDTHVEVRGGGTADPSQLVQLRATSLNSRGLQLADLVEPKSSSERVSYLRSPDSESPSPSTRLRRRLAKAGLLANVDPALVAKYTSERTERISPVPMDGKPLSQIVIEERER